MGTAKVEDAREPLISVEHLTVGYGGRALLEDLSFAVSAGEIFVILGGSGCGKSTVLRHLMGLEVPMAGRVRIRGHGAPTELTGPPVFGVLFQSGALFGSMTLLENVALPLQKWTRLPPLAIEAIALGRLRLVGLGGFENHLPAEISGGMKKRAGIARALALDPDLLLLDEPSAGLDPISSVELDELLLTLSRQLGVTSVLVTHELESVFKVATQCIMLDRDARGIIARGDPTALRECSQDARVQRFFNRLARPVESTPGSAGNEA